MDLKRKTILKTFYGKIQKSEMCFKNNSNKTWQCKINLSIIEHKCMDDLILHSSFVANKKLNMLKLQKSTLIFNN